MLEHQLQKLLLLLELCCGACPLALLAVQLAAHCHAAAAAAAPGVTAVWNLLTCLGCASPTVLLLLLDQRKQAEGYWSAACLLQLLPGLRPGTAQHSAAVAGHLWLCFAAAIALCAALS